MYCGDLSRLTRFVSFRVHLRRPCNSACSEESKERAPQGSWRADLLYIHCHVLKPVLKTQALAHKSCKCRTLGRRLNIATLQCWNWLEGRATCRFRWLKRRINNRVHFLSHRASVCGSCPAIQQLSTQSWLLKTFQTSVTQRWSQKTN